MEKVAPAVGKVLDQESEQHTLTEGSKPKLDNYCVREDARIAKRVANGHIVIQDHKHEHARLHICQRVDEKLLHEAGIKVNLFEIEPKDT